MKTYCLFFFFFLCFQQPLSAQLLREGQWGDETEVYNDTETKVTISFFKSENSCAPGSKSNHFRFNLTGTLKKYTQSIEVKFDYLNCEGRTVTMTESIDIGLGGQLGNIEKIDYKFTGSAVQKNYKTPSIFQTVQQYSTLPSFISALKMNVLYVGVENPLQINVTGVKPADVILTTDFGGTLSRQQDNPKIYVFRPSSPGLCTIHIKTQVNGAIKELGTQQFRIKRIPDPIPTVNGRLRGGNVQGAILSTQVGIAALLENFDFDARFEVVSFEMVFASKGEIFKAETQGAAFSQQMKNFMERAKPKDIIIIDEIKVVGPDNQPRKLGQIAFTVI